MAMRKRPFSTVRCLGVATLAAACLASGSLAAQATNAATSKAPDPKAAKTFTPTRLADGHPDLQGVYDVATITPLERPASLGSRLVLTDEEVANLEKYEQ